MQSLSGLLNRSAQQTEYTTLIRFQLDGALTQQFEVRQKEGTLIRLQQEERCSAGRFVSCRERVPVCVHIFSDIR
ncbi:hypothetical protein F2P81_015500 [Scophthalmus maximus]|uniref:Uncharacterized protein n=1 Tax=Scophthalmus maximus TaxID=52904 RepID=A0A6A4SMQ4_SCOMX|nr:hypothetical protein F2P81_015500 [Scophthalmus maximus]